MKFPYAKIEGHYKPIIDLVLHRDARFIRTDALVDSGADASLFHAAYPQELAIENLEDGPEVSFFGISGAPLRAYAHEVTIELGGNRFGPVQIAFSHDLSPDWFNILGQKDFFSLFPVKFTYNKQEIHLMSAGSDEQLD
jgi:hypothetical protein